MNDPDCLQGATMSASYNVSSINPDEVTLSGATSTGLVSEYRFVMLPPIPGGATTAALSNHNQRSTQARSILTIAPGVTGTFRVGLEVWDSCGVKAANTSIIS